MQNGKWQGTEHKVHMLKCWVSLSWPGSLCSVILISWEPRNLGRDLKSALHHDKLGRKLIPGVHLHPSLVPAKLKLELWNPCVAVWRLFWCEGCQSVRAQRRRCGWDQLCSWTSVKPTFSKTSPPREPRHGRWGHLGALLHPPGLN